MRDAFRLPHETHPNVHGLHGELDWAAAQVLATQGVALPVSFRTLRLAAVLWSPDLRWLLGRFPASASRYNPALGRGGLPDAICQWSVAGIHARGYGGLRRAVALATLSHLAVDACDPAHHCGVPGRAVTKVGPLTVVSDWEDPLTGPLSDPAEKHNHFERELARSTRSYHDVEALVYDVNPHLRRYWDTLVRKGQRDLTVEVIADVASTGIWAAYLTSGWSPQLSDNAARAIFPRAVAFSSALWRAVVEGREVS